MIGCFGCSFTSGQELENPITEAWPAQLGEMLGKPVENLGKPGCSNEFMLSMLRFHIHKFDQIVIGLTSPWRRQYHDSDREFTMWPGADYTASWCSAHPPRITLVKYLTAHSNDEFYRNKYLEQIDLMQVYLRYHKKQFIMFQALPTDLDIKQNLDLVRWPENSCTWFGENLAPQRHPNADGHKLIAEVLHEHIRSIGWLS